MPTIICPVCSTSFEGEQSRRYCSGVCYYARFTTPTQQQVMLERQAAKRQRENDSRRQRYGSDYHYRARLKTKSQRSLAKRRAEIAIGIRPKPPRSSSGYDSRKIYREVLFAMLLERDGNRCALCGELMTPATMCLDHIIPRFLGGKSIPRNVRVVHFTCNAGRPKTHALFLVP